MALASELVQFFQLTRHVATGGAGIIPPTLWDFLRSDATRANEINNLDFLVNRLERFGILTLLGTGPGDPPYNRQYMSRVRPDADGAADIAYGAYDFLAYGFPAMRNHFATAVLPIVVIQDGRDGIGTGFLLQDHKLVTARHCVEQMSSIKVPGIDLERTPVSRIVVAEDQSVDLAVLEFDGDPAIEAPGFALGAGAILEDVLTLGYPPIPGFHNVLVAERANLAGEIRSSVGEIVAEGRAYLEENAPYWLISARVKGGSSGGPVVSRMGKVLGIVSKMPAEAEGRADIMGYGVATPSSALLNLIDGTCATQGLDFEAREDIIVTA